MGKEEQEALRYSLTGPQVEPEAGYWTWEGHRIRVVEVDRLRGKTEAFDHSILDEERAELLFLAGNRDEPLEKVPDFSADRRRRPLSKFFRLQPPPISAVINTGKQDKIKDVFKQCEQRTAMVSTGQELARLFEAETPGLLHRHALNCILFERPVSPPRQARIWMALDLTIYSALLAAWHYKWAYATPIDSASADYSRCYAPRPIEYELARDVPPELTILYDTEPKDDGTEGGPSRCRDDDDDDDEVVSPGTPRHPAFPSGHSTYSAAASEILAYFFPDLREELENLADNIGMARLWAGVHWRQDHVAGQALGKAVAKEVEGQLRRDPVRQVTGFPSPCDPGANPSFQSVRSNALKTRDDVPQGPEQQDTIPSDSDLSIRARNSPQKGGVAF